MTALADALLRAESAHHAYEAQYGQTPWQQWYAHRLAAESEYREADLLEALISANIAHGIYEDSLGQGRDEQWAEWYAEHMQARLSREWYLAQALHATDYYF